MIPDHVYLKIYSVFKNYFAIFFHHFLKLFSTLKSKPCRSWRSASGVKEKCFRGQGEVCRGSRRSASGVKEYAWGVKENCFGWMCGIQLKHFSLTPDARFLDPGHTSPRPLTHFSLTWRAYFSELKKPKKMVAKM